jgi:uncharacterized protein YjiS (DUF1127 family)
MGRIVSNQVTIWSNASPRVWRGAHLPALRQMVRSFRTWRAARRAERELHALDDRTLKDIGLTRWEVRSAVRERQRMSRARPLLF